MKLCDHDACTGCEVCSIVCPTKSISMKADTLGFYYPEIDSLSCVDCHLCTQHCHILHEKPRNESSVKKIYAAWHSDDKIRMMSTSGGAFSALADAVFELNGYVVGAVYEDNFTVVHRIAHDPKDLDAQRGSKYVQSRMINILPELKVLLKEHPVLFCGTPCQVSAVKCFVGENSNLYTVDIVCHGVGSPTVFKKYLEYLSEHYHANVNKFRFRSKVNSWRYPSVCASFDDNQKYICSGLIDPMFVGFNKDVFQRESCYQCQYTHIDRPSDITISDFWGYEAINNDDLDDDYGISMVMVNTTNGGLLFEHAKTHMVIYERDLKQAMNGQPCLDHPTAKSPMRDEFLYDLDKSFEFLANKYFQPRYDFNPYYYYRANHTREKSARMKSTFRVIDAVSRRLKLQKIIINYIERKNKK